MKLAKKYQIPIIWFSIPKGQSFHSHLGIVVRATAIIHVEGEDENLSIGVMIYKGSC